MNGLVARLQPLVSGRQKTKWTSALVSLFVAVLVGSALAENSSSPATPRDFDQRFYGGIGIGVSELEPESTTPTLSVGDSSSEAYKLFLGFDLARHLSIEGFYADLGEAGIQFNNADVGEVEYQVAGLSALGYLFGSRLRDTGATSSALDSREGLAAYLRLGLGVMENQSNLNYDRDHKVHLHTGLGLEYGWANGLALRGEVAAYDSDAAFAGITLLKRFGKRSAPVVADTPREPFTATTDPEKTIVPPELSTVLFAFGKAELTPQTQAALDELASQLTENPDLTLSIEGHTDEIDTEEFNMMLSLNRAAAVKQYLQARGIDPMRMGMSGFGETRPIATNLTLEGRRLNRRVEIYLR